MIRKHTPFTYVIDDNPLGLDCCAKAASSWPDADWPGWYSYDYDCSLKRASDINLGHLIPAECSALLCRMAALPVREWFNILAMNSFLVPDLGLYGTGLHEFSAGGFLGRHLDADRHARLGLEKRLTGVLWVHQRWERDWGGELVLHGVGPRADVFIDPLPGRLVIFECSDRAWHSVTPVTCPPEVRRMSLAMSWWGAPSVEPGRRPRAHFEAENEVMRHCRMASTTTEIVTSERNRRRALEYLARNREGLE